MNVPIANVETIFIFSQDRLPEAYAAFIMECYMKIRLFPISKNDSILDSDIMSEFKGHDCMMVGFHNEGTVQQILKVAKSLFWILVEPGPGIVEKCSKVKGLYIQETQSPVMWIISDIETMTDTPCDPCHRKIAKYIDEYYFGYPSKKCVAFFKGLDDHTSFDLERYEKITIIEYKFQIDTTCDIGKSRLYDNRCVEPRLHNTTESTLVNGECEITILWSVGDCFVDGTCYRLAEKSLYGVGAMIRHDLYRNITEITVCCIKELGHNAKDIIKNICGENLIESVQFPHIAKGFIPGMTFPLCISTTITTDIHD